MHGNSANHMKNFLTSDRKATEKAIHKMRILLHVFKSLILITTIKVILRVFKTMSFRKESNKNEYYNFLKSLKSL